MNNRKKSKQEGRSHDAKERYEKDGVKQIPIDRVYCEVLLYCREINVWGPGKVKVEEKPRKKNVEVETELPQEGLSKEFKSCRNVPLNNPDVLFLVSTGRTRSQKYYETFLVDGEWNSSTRPEKEKDGGVSLEKINPLLTEVEENREARINRIAMTGIKKLMQAYNGEDMKVEYNKLNRMLENIGCPIIRRDPKKYKSWTKEAYAVSISEQRILLNEKDPNWLQQRQSDMTEENHTAKLFQAQNFEEDVNKELENQFFTLNNTAAYANHRLKKGFNFDTTVATPATPVAATDRVTTHDGVDDSGNTQPAFMTPSRQPAVAQTPSQSIGFSNLGEFTF